MSEEWAKGYYAGSIHTTCRPCGEWTEYEGPHRYCGLTAAPTDGPAAGLSFHHRCPKYTPEDGKPYPVLYCAVHQAWGEHNRGTEDHEWIEFGRREPRRYEYPVGGLPHDPPPDFDMGKWREERYQFLLDQEANWSTAVEDLIDILGDDHDEEECDNLADLVEEVRVLVQRLRRRVESLDETAKAREGS